MPDYPNMSLELSPLEVISFTIPGDDPASHTDYAAAEKSGNKHCLEPISILAGGCPSIYGRSCDGQISCNVCPPSEVIGTVCANTCRS